ncbi:GIY-YIG nuclease family protein [Candidatus Brachybacter algidus]|uniref:GIY-YIG nuclease family protein n=1 Tax=Candidatus Brachybacter algidus TaxID=2982024 RepID=UPI001B4F0FDB|nr:GIY-YIG nuclease family protein [Candidatus Brachybacter algidus]MBP9126604.1 GIY-YIG nuclease family protein [Saprospiraceae bacterium]MBK6447838.1 GIY-YIG nuclease family protein [Candidatus Brachybacter algidus]MBK8843734.1 GIY-YIG nuclease family protein [Candidatus Brachybacter algidus]MBL0117893.1 GIY-YIG nuclease family protein [Candidatus Brachybacter algidus]MBP9845377.1 GIY-YIG nuclease family protein [Saprospiraceae bacterium]
MNIENKKLSGIYCIENLIDSKKYIGSTTNFQKRYSKHLFELKNEIHSSHHLQQAYLKYGASNFRFDIIELFDKEIPDFEEILLKLENQYIEKNESNNKKYGYNLRISAFSNYGIKHSLSAKTRIKGKKLSASTKEKMSLARQGEKHPAAKLTKQTVKEIKILLEKGVRNTNIAKFFNINKSSINDIKNDNKWQSVIPTKDEIDSFDINLLDLKAQSRLNDYQVLMIKFLLRKEIPNYIIADYCNISQRIVTEIKNDKTYTQVDLNDQIFNELLEEFNFKKIEYLVKKNQEKRSKINKVKALVGELNPSSKLTKENVLEIKKLLNSGLTLQKISNTFNVTIDCIAKIKSGDNWAHLTGIRKQRTGLLKGSKHPNFKHPDKVVLKIIELTNIGLTTKEICKELTLEKTFVNRVKSGKTRSELTLIKTRR